MKRRTFLLAQIALVAALSALAFPSASSALATVPIVLTASGPSPADEEIAGAENPIWLNNDTVTHTVAFADGCSFDVAAGASAVGKCVSSWSSLGTHPYTVDSTFDGSLTRVPSYRRVTLTSPRHGFRLGSSVRLHGIVQSHYGGAPPGDASAGMPVMVFARSDRFHPWHRIAVVKARPAKTSNWLNHHSVWQLWVRPRGHTTYMVEVNSKPDTWEQATSRLFGLYVRPRSTQAPSVL